MLTFSIMVSLLYFLDYLTGNGLSGLFGLNFPSSIPVLSYVTYVLCHADLEHLFANLSFILLLGPILEEKYGSMKMGLLFLSTTIITAVIHNVVFSSGLVGASGLVFMLIVLISFTGNQSGKIPLTFILVASLYIGREVVAAFNTDQVSQFGHIFGGLLGGLFGFLLTKPKLDQAD